jgi:transcriptional regulator with XRE-family HTH domain
MTRAAQKPIETRTEPVIGWRCWFTLPEEALLRPIFMRGIVWTPREALEARCPEQLHQPPADGCRCGVWAVCHPKLLDEVNWIVNPPQDREPLPGVVVVGQVALWGQVTEHERGWRASRAYPTHLYAFTKDDALARALRERYLVPVACGEEADRLLDVLPHEFREALGRRRLPPTAATLPGQSAGVLANLIGEREVQDLDRLREDLALARSRVDAEAASLRTLLQEQQQQCESLAGLREQLDKERLATVEASAAASEARMAAQREMGAAERANNRQSRLAEREARRAAIAPLRAELIAAGITQAEVADRAGVIPSSVSNALSGAWLSQNIIGAARALLAERPARPAEPPPPRRAASLPHGPRPISAGYPALAARLLEHGITRAQVAQLAGCSGSLVWHVLAGRVQSAPVVEAVQTLLACADARGRVTRESVLVRVRALGWNQDELASRIGYEPGFVSSVLHGRVESSRTWKRIDRVLLLAEAARMRPASVSSPIEGDGPRVIVSPAALREELARERAELDEVRRRVAAERAEAVAAQRLLERKRRQLDVDARKIARVAEVARARHVAAGLRRRLEKAGISQTRLARAAGVSIGNVCHLLAGTSMSTRVVVAAEKLLAKKKR